VSLFRVATRTPGLADDVCSAAEDRIHAYDHVGIPVELHRRAHYLSDRGDLGVDYVVLPLQF